MNIKYQILEKINYINYYHRKGIEAHRRKRWFLIAFGTLLITIGAFSALGYIHFVVTKPPYFDIAVLGFGMALVGVSVWALTWKVYYFPTGNLDTLQSDELKAYLKKVTEIEEARLDSGARRVAASWATVLTILIFLVIDSVARFMKYGQFHFMGKKLTDEGFLFGVFFLITFLVFDVATLFAGPMTPVKYRKEKEKLANRIIFSFLTDIDDSLINPVKENNS